MKVLHIGLGAYEALNLTSRCQVDSPLYHVADLTPRCIKQREYITWNFPFHSLLLFAAVRFDSPLHDVAVRCDSPLHDVAERFDSTLHDAAGVSLQFNSKM